MKYKSLLVLSLAVVMTSCKMAEIQDNISISGYWAQLNSVSQAKSFVRFDKGLFYTYSLPLLLLMERSGAMMKMNSKSLKSVDAGIQLMAVCCRSMLIRMIGQGKFR